MPKTIKEKQQIIKDKLAKHDAKRKVIEAELVALRMICPHADVETWTHTDYKCETDHHWLCKDCGLSKVT